LLDVNKVKGTKRKFFHSVNQYFFGHLSCIYIAFDEKKLRREKDPPCVSHSP